MAEEKRGCGFRKIGGLYLAGSGIGVNCHRLPLIIPPCCPTCSAGTKYSRGFTWISPKGFFGRCPDKEPAHTIPCHKTGCSVCFPPEDRHGLMWIGKKFYTPDEFTREANLMGLSKRISAVPRNFKLGETWIYLAHLEAGERPLTEEEKQENAQKEIFAETKRVPAVFYVFKPDRIEKIVTEEDFKDEEKMEKLKKQGLTPVPVPDDAKHRGTVHDKKSDEEE